LSAQTRISQTPFLLVDTARAPKPKQVADQEV